MIKVKLERDLTITLKGVHVEDLRYILTAASIRHYETEKELKEKKPSSIDFSDVEEANIKFEREWASLVREIIDALSKEINDEIQLFNSSTKKRKAK